MKNIFRFFILINLIAFFYAFSEPNSMLKKELKSGSFLFLILVILIYLITYLVSKYILFKNKTNHK